MELFDRIDPLKLDRRDTQLWLLAIAMILILASGIALLIYPAAFSRAVAISGPHMRRVFVGFCALSLLLTGYLIDRHLAIRQLRRRLVEEEGRNARLLQQASVELLDSLPNFEHFQDRLTMEFRRAVIAMQPLSLIAVSLSPGNLSGSEDLSTAYGDAAKSILRRMRKEDSIFLFRPGVFGVVLPTASAIDGEHISQRLTKGLDDAAGTPRRFSFELKVINYPDHAATAREIETLATNAFPQRLAQAA